MLIRSEILKNISPIVDLVTMSTDNGKRPMLIACGRSGLLLAGQVQAVVPVEVFTVRKPGEKVINYYGHGGDGKSPSSSCNIFVDDLSSSGRTWWRAYLAVKARGYAIQYAVFQSSGYTWSQTNYRNAFKEMPELQTVWAAGNRFDRPTYTEAPNAVLPERPNDSTWDPVPASWGWC